MSDGIDEEIVMRKGRLLKFAELTWEEIRDLPPERTIALLPIGAVEAHGPHLPLSTDVVISEAMAERAAELLPGAIGPTDRCDGGPPMPWRAVVMPPVWYTSATFASGFPGTLGVRPETVTALIVEIAEGLQATGFRALTLAKSSRTSA